MTPADVKVFEERSQTANLSGVSLDDRKAIKEQLEKQDADVERYMSNEQTTLPPSLVFRGRGSGPSEYRRLSPKATIFHPS